MANFESDGIQNLAGFDAFKDADEEAGDQSKVHIRVQQRNGRKCITTVQGLNQDLDLKKILKALKKQECCNGSTRLGRELEPRRARRNKKNGGRRCGRAAAAAAAASSSSEQSSFLFIPLL